MPIVGTPGIDCPRMAAYLCSEDAGFFTGQVIVVDGGTTTLMSLMSDFRRQSTARFGTGFVPGVCAAGGLRTPMIKFAHGRWEFLEIS